jgi:hypothetical protein
MAEIRVQPRRNTRWIWLLLALIVIGAIVAYYFFFSTPTVV